jgi:hypothetical protein
MLNSKSWERKILEKDLEMGLVVYAISGVSMVIVSMRNLGSLIFL